MKTPAKHAVHPSILSSVAALDTALAAIYPSKDYAYQIAVEGQIVATTGLHINTVPVAWKPNEIAAEVEKRKNLPSVETRTRVTDPEPPTPPQS